MAGAIRAGRPFSAASRRRSKCSPSTCLSERRTSPLPLDSPDEPSWSDATGRSVRPWVTLTPTFRFRTRTTGSASKGRCILHPGDRTIAMRKLLLLGLALLPAHVGAQDKAGRIMLEAGLGGGCGEACPGHYVGIKGRVAGAGVSVRHGRDLPMRRFRGLRSPSAFSHGVGWKTHQREDGPPSQAEGRRPTALFGGSDTARPRATIAYPGCRCHPLGPASGSSSVPVLVLGARAAWTPVLPAGPAPPSSPPGLKARRRRS